MPLQSALATIKGNLLAKPNYQFEKRQKDLAKKRETSRLPELDPLQDHPGGVHIRRVVRAGHPEGGPLEPLEDHAERLILPRRSWRPDARPQHSSHSLTPEPMIWVLVFL